MTMILVARCLERIGDNAVDIGEQIAFVVTGRVPGVHRRLALTFTTNAPDLHLLQAHDRDRRPDSSRRTPMGAHVIGEKGVRRP